MATNTDKILAGYEESIGGKLLAIVDHAGPVSYVAGGETYSSLNLNRGGFDWIDQMSTFGASSGNRVYNVSVGIPAGSQGSGTPTVNLKWSFAAVESGVNSIVITNAGTGYTPGTYTSASSGGGGTGAIVQYTVAAGGTITAASVLNPGSGYTSVPTFAVAAPAGSAGALTATIGSISGVEVSPGTNLNSTYVRLMAILY